MSQRVIEMRDTSSRFDTRARRCDELARRLRGRRKELSNGVEKR
jgi:hypothetical protein